MSTSLVSKAIQQCRVCVETPFEKIFGFKSSGDEEMCSIYSEVDGASSEEASRVKSLVMRVHPRARELWPDPGELEKVLSAFVVRFAFFHSMLCCSFYCS